MTGFFSKSHIKEGNLQQIKLKFQNEQASSVSVLNTYSEYQLMHKFLDKFHQGGKYSAEIAIHQKESRREETFTDQKSSSISSLQNDYLNLDRSSDCGRNSERENNIKTRCTFCGRVNHSAEMFFKRIRQEKEKARAAGDSDNIQMKRMPRKCFRCGSVDHPIEKCPKPPKYNEKQRKQVHFNEKDNGAYNNRKK